MTASQIAWFKEGVGCDGTAPCYFTASNLLWAIQAIGAVAVFTYVAWLCIRAYTDYGEKALQQTTCYFFG